MTTLIYDGMVIHKYSYDLLISPFDYSFEDFSQIFSTSVLLGLNSYINVLVLSYLVIVKLYLSFIIFVDFCIPF